jgi:Flp pilus assembly protein TadG
MNNDDLIITDSVLDLGDVGAAQETITVGSGGIDTITLSDYSLMSSTITIPSYSISGAVGTGYTSANSQWATGSNGYTFTNTTPQTVHINNTGIDMAAGADIKIDGKSLKEFMSKMEQRMAILIPDPAKLEKFQALKRAYEHYKTMESLCFDEQEESK